MIKTWWHIALVSILFVGQVNCVSKNTNLPLYYIPSDLEQAHQDSLVQVRWPALPGGGDHYGHLARIDAWPLWLHTRGGAGQALLSPGRHIVRYYGSFGSEPVYSWDIESYFESFTGTTDGGEIEVCLEAGASYRWNPSVCNFTKDK